MKRLAAIRKGQRMKTFLIAIALVALACIAGLLLANAARALFTGESFPPPRMQDKLIYTIRVPAPSPATP